MLFSPVETQSQIDALQLDIIEFYARITTLVRKSFNGRLLVCHKSAKYFLFRIVLAFLYLVASWYQFLLIYKEIMVSQLMHALVFEVGIAAHIPVLVETFRKRYEISALFESFGRLEKQHRGKFIKN